MNTIAKTFMDRKVKSEETFEDHGFQYGSWNLALRWLYNNGYQTGNTDLNNPVGIMMKRYSVKWKWSELSNSEKEELDGVVVSENFINRPVKVIIFESKNKDNG